MVDFNPTDIPIEALRFSSRRFIYFCPKCERSFLPAQGSKAPDKGIKLVVCDDCQVGKRRRKK